MDNPKILLVGCLPNSNKLNLFLNYEHCKRRKHHRLGQQPAIGVQLNTLPFIYNGAKIYLDIWNLVIRNEHYDRLAPIYMANTFAIVGVCSMTSQYSFDKMKYWINKYCCQNQTDVQKSSTSLSSICCFSSPTTITTHGLIYILAYDDSTYNGKTLIINEQCLNEYAETITGQHSHQTTIRVFIIRQHSQGRDLNKFFNHLLNNIRCSMMKQISTKSKPSPTTKLKAVRFDCMIRKLHGKLLKPNKYKSAGYLRNRTLNICFSKKTKTKAKRTLFSTFKLS